tara:strand:+ start:1284 stop:1496 length:213 start_codon:yes stop_codon:yes gene_type:complete
MRGSEVSYSLSISYGLSFIGSFLSATSESFRVILEISHQVINERPIIEINDEIRRFESVQSDKKTPTMEG